jgi:hypothetical protein
MFQTYLHVFLATVTEITVEIIYTGLQFTPISFAKKEIRMKMTVLLDVVPCSLTEINRCFFRSSYCLQDQGDDASTSKTSASFDQTTRS